MTMKGPGDTCSSCEKMQLVLAISYPGDTGTVVCPNCDCVADWTTKPQIIRR